MKRTIAITVIMLSILACQPEDSKISQDCTYTATVVDLEGLDGCGFVFQLDNGDYLEPVWRWGWCGTPPLPKEATEDPLYDFTFVAGQRVRLGFEAAEEMGSICMAGKPVYITCLEVIGEVAVE
ncbi:hypothetical protein [Marivirga sp.]|uniref:hypothetical protein n=1 Tax=Marivirga sp. TaxID=2018662 RepID=UPI003DA6E312